MLLIAREITAQSGADLSNSPDVLQEIRLASERVKCRLSFEEKAEIVLTFPDKKIDYRRTISRTEFDALITEFVEKTLDRVARRWPMPISNRNRSTR